MFQDLPDQQAILIEEMRIVQENVDDIKRLFEGAQMKVDVKNKDARILKRTPVIVCSNSTPERWVVEEQQALRNRMILYELQPFENLKNMSKDINPLAWLQFMLDLESNDDDETESVTSDASTVEYEPSQEVIVLDTPPDIKIETISFENKDTIEDVFAKYQTQPETEEGFKDMCDETLKAEKNELLKDLITKYGLEEFIDI